MPTRCSVIVANPLLPIGYRSVLELPSQKRKRFAYSQPPFYLHVELRALRMASPSRQWDEPPEAASRELLSGNPRGKCCFEPESDRLQAMSLEMGDRESISQYRSTSFEDKRPRPKDPNPSGAGRQLLGRRWYPGPLSGQNANLLPQIGSGSQKETEQPVYALRKQDWGCRQSGRRQSQPLQASRARTSSFEAPRGSRTTRRIEYGNQSAKWGFCNAHIMKHLREKDNLVHLHGENA